MEIKVQVPFQQLLTLVKSLTPGQKARLRQELAEKKPSGKGKDDFIEYLPYLTKLKILEQSFIEINPDKYPKMFVICEDTSVSPLVTEFLIQEGFSNDDVMQIDSDRKGNIPDKEWQQVKQRLFNVDKHSYPRVIVSVLMLREGFDVNNICVIVPLRSAQAPILLEQTIGRGLR